MVGSCRSIEPWRFRSGSHSAPQTEDELYKLWAECRATLNAPKVGLPDGDGVVSIALHQNDGDWLGIENIGRAIAVAAHRKYADQIVDYIGA
jgi:hypothetical protein